MSADPRRVTFPADGVTDEFDEFVARAFASGVTLGCDDYDELMDDLYTEWSGLQPASDQLVRVGAVVALEDIPF